MTETALTSLTEEERTRALDRFRMLCPFLEQGVPLTTVAKENGAALRTLWRLGRALPPWRFGSARSQGAQRQKETAVLASPPTSHRGARLPEATPFLRRDPSPGGWGCRSPGRTPSQLHECLQAHPAAGRRAPGVSPRGDEGLLRTLRFAAPQGGRGTQCGMARRPRGARHLDHR